MMFLISTSAASSLVKAADAPVGGVWARAVATMREAIIRVTFRDM
jgi:hypothetical protein